MKLATAAAVLAIVALASSAHAQAPDYGPWYNGPIVGGTGGYQDPMTFDPSSYYWQEVQDCQQNEMFTTEMTLLCTFTSGIIDPVINFACYAMAAGMLEAPGCRALLSGTSGHGGPYLVYPGEL